MAASSNCFFNLFPLSCKHVGKTVSLLQKFQNVLPGTTKLFIIPHLDHGDVIHYQAYNFTFHQKLKSFQCFPRNHRYHKGNFLRKALLGTGPWITSHQIEQRALIFCLDIQYSKSSDYFLISTLKRL